MGDRYSSDSVGDEQILASIGELLSNVPNGRGIATLFVISGILGLVVTPGGYVFKPLRNLQ